MLPYPEEVPGVALVPIGSGGRHFDAAVAMGIIWFRIGLLIR